MSMRDFYRLCATMTSILFAGTGLFWIITVLSYYPGNPLSMQEDMVCIALGLLGVLGALITDSAWRTCNPQ